MIMLVGGGGGKLFLHGLHKPIVFFSPHAFPCSRTPFEACRPDIPRDGLVARLALDIDLIRPYLIDSVAPVADELLGMGAPYLLTSWTTFLKHSYSLPDQKNIAMR